MPHTLHTFPQPSAPHTLHVLPSLCCARPLRSLPAVRSLPTRVHLRVAQVGEHEMAKQAWLSVIAKRCDVVPHTAHALPLPFVRSSH